MYPNLFVGHVRPIGWGAERCGYNRLGGHDWERTFLEGHNLELTFLEGHICELMFLEGYDCELMFLQGHESVAESPSPVGVFY